MSDNYRVYIYAATGVGFTSLDVENGSTNVDAISETLHGPYTTSDGLTDVYMVDVLLSDSSGANSNSIRLRNVVTTDGSNWGYTTNLNLNTALPAYNSSGSTNALTGTLIGGRATIPVRVTVAKGATILSASFTEGANGIPLAVESSSLAYGDNVNFDIYTYVLIHEAASLGTTAAVSGTIITSDGGDFGLESPESATLTTQVGSGTVRSTIVPGWFEPIKPYVYYQDTGTATADFYEGDSLAVDTSLFAKSIRGGTLTYSLDGSGDAGLFTVDSATGVVSFIDVANATLGTAYNITLLVTDSNGEINGRSFIITGIAAIPTVALPRSGGLTKNLGFALSAATVTSQHGHDFTNSTGMDINLGVGTLLQQSGNGNPTAHSYTIMPLEFANETDTLNISDGANMVALRLYDSETRSGSVNDDNTLSAVDDSVIFVVPDGCTFRARWVEIAA